MWLEPPIVDHFPYSKGCTVCSQFNGSADIRLDGESEVAVTKVEKVLVKNFCFTDHRQGSSSKFSY